jgi:hypothetical protein
MVMGPFGTILIRVVNKAAKKAARKAGKAMGNQVRKDVRAAEKRLQIPGQDHYEDLATKDSGVSPSWIDGLINRSKSPEQLEKIRTYLTDPMRSGNLPPPTHGSLLSQVADKLEYMEQQAFLQKLMANRKNVEKLLDLLNDIL